MSTEYVRNPGSEGVAEEEIIIRPGCSSCCCHYPIRTGPVLNEGSSEDLS
jgi:hypothetical protein